MVGVFNGFGSHSFPQVYINCSGSKTLDAPNALGYPIPHMFTANRQSSRAQLPYLVPENEPCIHNLCHVCAASTLLETRRRT